MRAEPHVRLGLEALLEWAGEAAGTPRGNAAAAPLPGDGSERRFFRIRSGAFSFVGLISPRTAGGPIDENDSYLAIGRHLFSRGIPVPRILFADAERGHFLLEDAGDLHLQTYVRRGGKDLEKVYRRVLLLLATLHKRTPEGFSAAFCFDTPLYDPAFVYERELEYFRKSFLAGYLGVRTVPDGLRSDFEALAEAAGVRQSRFVFHRDFQSRNIMVCQNRLRLLDFQGMRFGPPAYDLASLLVDPYVMLPRGLQARLAGVYWSAACKFLGCSRGDFWKSYVAVRLARNLQILGAFAFLGLVKEKRGFLRHIPWAWRQLREWLAEECGGRYPKLERLVREAEEPARAAAIFQESANKMNDIRARICYRSKHLCQSIDLTPGGFSAPALLFRQETGSGFENAKDRNNKGQEERSQ